jgi:DNA adenine methylase
MALEFSEFYTNRDNVTNIFDVKKKEFLQLLASTGKNAYKRYTGSTLRYPGGKSLAVGLILERIPKGVSKVVSPFFGGGSVEIALAKEVGMEVIGYDVFDLLTNYWDIQFTKTEQLVQKLKQFNPSREGFSQVKEVLKAHWKNEKKIRGNINLAAHYYFNHNTSYGPHFLGSPSSVYLDDKRYNKLLEKVSKLSLSNIKVSCESFLTSIPRHSDDFLYCDPPYYLDGDSKTFIGLYPHRNFPIHHKGFKHEELRDMLMGHKGGFILSYNDCSTIREWYKDCEMIAPKWQYTFSQGDTRIGENRLKSNNGSHIKESHELLIWKNPQK